MRCTLTVAACQCPAKKANAVPVNGEDSDTTEGPGFVSQAFRNNLALLQTWVAKHAGELPLRNGKRANETNLSKWINNLRQAHKARSLNRTHLDLLTSIPSISIENSDTAWEKTCVELRSWLETHHRTNEDGSKTWQYPHRHAEDKTERNLADWLKNNRRWQNEAASVKSNFIAEARQKHLEALPGWSHGGMETKSQQRYQCAGTCGQMLGRESFTDTQWLQGVRKKCINCCGNSGRPRVDSQSQRQKCQGSCGQDLSKDIFAARQWHRNEQVCKACAAAQRTAKRTAENMAHSSTKSKRTKK